MHSTIIPSEYSQIWSSIIRAKNTLKSGFSWRASSGNTSFSYYPWTNLGYLGTLVPYIDIHDIHLSVKDMISSNNPHTQVFYTILPPLVSDIINNMHMNFNDTIEDSFIWSSNKNGIYTTKSGYRWLISQNANNENHSWSWIWKLKIPEKIKFLVWLACHSSVPTLSLLNHRNISTSATCSRCGQHEETFLHCVRDCEFSRNIWYHFNFNHSSFFNCLIPHEWLKRGC